MLNFALSKISVFLFFCFLFSSSQAFASTPYLAFSDLMSGPDTGLNDGKGSGVIVTVWGQNLGAQSSANNLYFTDSAGEEHLAVIYYWKNANGEAPSGPANLYSSHEMQEIAFSIPRSHYGVGKIQIQVGDKRSNELPFTVRTGDIYHIKDTEGVGGNGSWSKPWQSVDDALSKAGAGSTLYIHNVNVGGFKSPADRGIYWNNSDASSGKNNQYSLVSYPGFQPKVIAQKGISNYTTEGMVVSKLDIYSSNYLAVDLNGQPVGPVISPGDTFGIQTSKNGRAIANRIGDIPGGCANKWNGAINGNATYGDRVSNFKALGNEIYDYGCEGTSKLHHTIYLSVRSKSGLVVEPWEWGYNYLHGNKAKFGIHQYDENEGCGNISGPIKIYNNVILEQAGAGISVGSTCGWSMDVYIENNVLINVGLAAAWDGINTSSSVEENGGIAFRDAGLLGTMYVYNNLIYHPTPDGQKLGGKGCLNFNANGDNVSVLWSKNICVIKDDGVFVGAGFNADNKLDNVEGDFNIWYFSGSPTKTLPSWDAHGMNVDPELSFKGARVYLNTQSLAFTQGFLGADTEIPVQLGYTSNRDIYGNVRSKDTLQIGPVTYTVAYPEAPTNLLIR